MEIKIKNCNNIDEASIDIIESILNIKYGINGSGKSTIAKAIEYSIDETKNLSELTPFKLLSSDIKPEIIGINNINNVLIFNEDYVNKFLFQRKLIDNSFDIFIKTPLYEEKIKTINLKIKEIKDFFINNSDLSEAISKLKELSDNFKLTATGINKACKGSKSLIDGDILANIPSELKNYEVFLRSDKKFEWIAWHNEGKDYLELSSNCCPYCTSSLTEKMEPINKLDIQYGSTNMKNLVSIVENIDKLKDYFSEDAISSFEDIKTKGLSDQSNIKFIMLLKNEADILVGKLSKLQTLSHENFREIKNVKEILEPLQINIDHTNPFNSEKTNKLIFSLNEHLDNVLGKATELQKEVGIQKSEVNKIIGENQREINSFLKNAGYRYEVFLLLENGEYELKLKHFDSEEFLHNENRYLSFGEKNAFALALFMYNALSKNLDLIILDDPISSFDNNKKYAIMQMLFKGKKCFAGKTVLMLTHDIEPVIDTIKVLDSYKDIATSSYLSFKNGLLTEQIIKKEDILTFPQICNEIIESATNDDIIKLIYLRREYEILGIKDNAYQVISNLLKKRERTLATDHRKGEEICMDVVDFENGIQVLIDKIENFDYEEILKRLNDDEKMVEMYKSVKNGYEKLLLFRIIFEKHPNPNINKFIKESYHTENEFIHQLNPRKFELIPNFIIDECDKIIASVII
ncbi:MAG: AAA family ATPase [Candidatus Paceibacterota bacterium]